MTRQPPSPSFSPVAYDPSPPFSPSPVAGFSPSPLLLPSPLLPRRRPWREGKEVGEGEKRREKPPSPAIERRGEGRRRGEEEGREGEPAMERRIGGRRRGEEEGEAAVAGHGKKGRREEKGRSRRREKGRKEEKGCRRRGRRGEAGDGRRGEGRRRVAGEKGRSRQRGRREEKGADIAATWHPRVCHVSSFACMVEYSGEYSAMLAARDLSGIHTKR